jgi:hypothetical protein
MVRRSLPNNDAHSAFTRLSLMGRGDSIAHVARTLTVGRTTSHSASLQRASFERQIICVQYSKSYVTSDVTFERLYRIYCTNNAQKCYIMVWYVSLE